jgi:hypothetical protein
MLTVLEMIYVLGEDTKARCICTCGKERIAMAYNLKNGNTRSCGCISAAMLKPEADRESMLLAKIARIKEVGYRNRRHGHTCVVDHDGQRCHSKTYSSWSDAKKRCFRPQNKRYPEYGGRGITMCDAWRNSFEAFLADMGEMPDGTTLDRIDVNGNYEPGNCRWATKLQQARNTRANVATWESVVAIRAAYEAGAKTKVLAARFGMSDSNVLMIVQRKTWREAS